RRQAFDSDGRGCCQVHRKEPFDGIGAVCPTGGRQGWVTEGRLGEDPPLIEESLAVMGAVYFDPPEFAEERGPDGLGLREHFLDEGGRKVRERFGRRVHRSTPYLGPRLVSGQSRYCSRRNCR